MTASRSNLTLKFTALAGVAASASTAHAAVVSSSTVGSGLTPPGSPGSTFWDVDNDGTADFRLLHGSPSSSSSSNNEANFDDVNGGRLAGASARSSDLIAKLEAGFVVSGSMSGFHFVNSPQASVTITNYGSIGGDAGGQGWNIGDTGYFGFKFTTGESTHYGWGVLSITGSPTGQGFSILEAHYETTPDLGIMVGSTSSIPEPASAAALLGLGAAGVAAWRRRRVQAN